MEVVESVEAAVDAAAATAGGSLVVEECRGDRRGEDDIGLGERFCSGWSVAE